MSRFVPYKIVTPFMRSERQRQVPLDQGIPEYVRCLHVEGIEVAPIPTYLSDETAYTEVHIGVVNLLHWVWPFTGAHVAFGLCETCLTFHYACWEQEESIPVHPRCRCWPVHHEEEGCIKALPS